VYNYKILNSFAGQMLNNKKENETKIKTGACGHAGLIKTHFKNGVSLKYLYKDEDGNLLLSVKVTPKDCGL
jgi:hypothetical protein